MKTLYLNNTIVNRKICRDIRNNAICLPTPYDIDNNKTVIFIGQTGYGKSTTINTIINRPLFATDDVKSCTRHSQEVFVEFISNSKKGVILCDMPGIGEASATDKRYKEAYFEKLRRTSFVVYVLRADKRDFKLDLRLIREILNNTKGIKTKLLFAINYADKVEPINRTSVRLTAEQVSNIQKFKENFCKELAGTLKLTPDEMLHYSASLPLNINNLFVAIINKTFGWQINIPNENISNDTVDNGRNSNEIESIETNTEDAFGLGCQKQQPNNTSTDRLANIEYRIGHNYYQQRNYSTAFGQLKAAASKGHPDALFDLGLCYYYGRGIPINASKAFECMLHAAKMNHIEAKYWQYKLSIEEE